MPGKMKCRKVDFLPQTDIFEPQCKEGEVKREYILKIEELEAMRLKDVEELSQEACAEKMNVSRQTFQTIIDIARKKVVLALIGAATIRIGGGCYVTKKCRILCSDCGNAYEPGFEEDKVACPQCGSHKIHCMKKNTHCMKWCCGEDKE
jgi:predicted DNA-binding protein (UPF0251 family)